MTDRSRNRRFSRVPAPLVGALSLALLAACAPATNANAPGAAAPTAAAPATVRGPVMASATLQPKPGTAVGGTVTFTEANGMVQIQAKVTGVAAGTHGFHIHEKGDCGDVEFKNAGGHFNPKAAMHGAPTDSDHHAGDLGNIEIAADGSGALAISSDMLTVGPGDISVVGRAVILHEKADDLKTQPTGDAGGRIACGVIAVSAPAMDN